MDINLLALNIGNSRLAVGAFVGGELVFVKRVPNDDRSQIRDAISEAWKKLEDRDEPTIAGASVNPTMSDTIEHMVLQSLGRTVHWVGEEIDLPMKVLTDAPDQTGVDRIINMAAAYEQ